MKDSLGKNRAEDRQGPERMNEKKGPRVKEMNGYD